MAHKPKLKNDVTQYLSTLGIRTDDAWHTKVTGYYDALVSTNRQQNLTRITDYADFMTKHIVDSLAILQVFPELLANSHHIADVGCGAGFPGLPLAICCPQSQFVEIDSTQRKVKFVADCIDRLSLSNCRAVAGRARELGRGELAGTFDFVLARAVSDSGSLMRECRQLLKPSGSLICYKTPSGIEQETKTTARDAKKYGFVVSMSDVITLPNDAGTRQFVHLQRGA